MPYIIHSEAGHGHQNEDSVQIRAHPREASVLLCALADGQGGQYGGAAASRTAVAKCLELASTYSAKQLSTDSTWQKILSAADQAIADEKDAGYTTLIGLCVLENQVFGASCGDSAVLLLNGNQHSLLTEQQRKNPPIGSAAAIPVAFSARLKPGFQLLVVSDGVWKYVGWEAIIQLCSKQRGQQLVSALRQLSLEQNGGRLPDDFSIGLLS